MHKQRAEVQPPINLLSLRGCRKEWSGTGIRQPLARGKAEILSKEEKGL